ncbi:hypothetical protein N7450_000403 [Penicillium hetheringtonii]|uniref:Uncharacterized protein n=1 Tax=Penicillium hetheringtonii TaxID=911720 RepID=A0AAD6E2P9_9EURO|nr:hypothetical protein N7450_000403 [Penicillium hetheringtonii]
MRYTLINGLLMLAISPFTALALPVDPNDQGGVWDPSGQYRKGHYDGQGNFIGNDVGRTGYENGYQNEQWRNEQNQNYQNGQWRDNYQNDQYNQNGQYNQDGRYNQAGRWQRRWVPGQGVAEAAGLHNHGTQFGTPRVGVPGTGIHARNWPYDNNNNNNGGWTDANGQWHANNQQGGWTDANGQWHANNQQGGWTDANGQWHANNNNNGAGWTDANGQWHANNNQQGGWTDANGQWHANQKRGFEPTATTNLASNPNLLNQAQASNPLNAGQGNIAGAGAGINNAAGLPHVPRHYNPDEYDHDRYNNDHYDNSYNDGYRDGRYNNEEDRRVAEHVVGNILTRRIWPFSSWNRDDDRNWDRNCDRNDWNCRNRYNDNGRYNDNDRYGYDKCKSDDRADRSGWSCRSDWDRTRATPTPRVWTRNTPNDNAKFDNKDVDYSDKVNKVNAGTGASTNADYKGYENKDLNKDLKNKDYDKKKATTTTTDKQ